jgi:hypothetical protein
MGGWSLESIFQIVQTFAILFGIPVIAFRLGRGTEAVKASIATQGLTVNAIVQQLKELKDEQKEFRTILTQVAVQNTRLDNQGSQLTMLAKMVEDIRRGEGFILPLKAAQEIK